MGRGERTRQENKSHLRTTPSHTTSSRAEGVQAAPFAAPFSLNPSQILGLQSSVGNQAVQRLLQSSGSEHQGEVQPRHEKQAERYEATPSQSIKTLPLSRNSIEPKIQRKLQPAGKNPDRFQDWWYDDAETRTNLNPFLDKIYYKIVQQTTTHIEVKEVDQITGKTFDPSYYYDRDGNHRISSPPPSLLPSSSQPFSYESDEEFNPRRGEKEKESSLAPSLGPSLSYLRGGGGTLSATAEFYAQEAHDKFKVGTDEERLIPKDKQKLNDPSRLEKHAKKFEKIVDKATKEKERKEEKRQDESDTNHLLSHSSQTLDKAEKGISKAKWVKDKVFGLPAKGLSVVTGAVKDKRREMRHTTSRDGEHYKSLEFEQRKQLGMGTGTKYMVREDNLLGETQIPEGSSLDFYRTLQSRLPVGGESKASREEASSFTDTSAANAPGHTEGTKADNIAISNLQQGGGLLDGVQQIVSLKKEIRDLKGTIAEEGEGALGELEESLTRLDILEGKLRQAEIDTGVDTSRVVLGGVGQVFGPASTASTVLLSIKNIKNHSIRIAEVSHHLATLQAALNDHIESGGYHIANIVAGVIHRLTKERRSLITKINTDTAKAIASIGLFFAPGIAQKIGTAPISIGETATRGIKKMRHKKKLGELHGSLTEALERGKSREADELAAELVTRDPVYLAQAIAEFFAAGSGHPALEALLVWMGMSANDFREKDPEKRRAKILLLQQKLKTLGWWDKASKVTEEKKEKNDALY